MTAIFHPLAEDLPNKISPVNDTLIKASSHWPARQSYEELMLAYEHFNHALFEGSLPYCMITLQSVKRTFGYFSSKRYGNHSGETADEICLNPSYFAVIPLTEIMATLVHEMVHLWQAHFGDPGRGRYHNDEWANRMESIGLMPSSTGRPGGKRTGDRIADYPIVGGRFLDACRSLLTTDFKISWHDRFTDVEQVNAGLASMTMHLEADVGGGSTTADIHVVRNNLVMPAATTNTADQNAPIREDKSNRTKYSCPCETNVWAKPGLNLICGNCGSRFMKWNPKPPAAAQ